MNSVTYNNKVDNTRTIGKIKEILELDMEQRHVFLKASSLHPEGAKVTTDVNSDLLTNKQLKIQSKMSSTDKLDTDFGYFSDVNYFSDFGDFNDVSYLSVSSDVSYFKRCDEESVVRPESLHQAHKKTEADNNKDVISENVNVTEKSVTFFELYNQEAEETMKVKPTKNKNQTLAKPSCTNSSRNTLLELSEGQSSPRKDVFENEELRLPSRDGERDENGNHSQNKPEASCQHQMEEAKVVTMLQFGKIKETPLQLKHNQSTTSKNSATDYKDNINTGCVNAESTVGPELKGINKSVLTKRNKNQIPKVSTHENTCEKPLQKLSDDGYNSWNDIANVDKHILSNNCEGETMSCFQQKKKDGDYKDFVIHHSENDKDLALAFRHDLLHLGIQNLTVDIFEDIHIGASEMESTSVLYKQYKTVLLLVTSNYVHDEIRRYQAELLLWQSFRNKALKNWVVPVWTESGMENVVPELFIIKGIQYHQSANTELFPKQIKDLVVSGRSR